MVRHPQGYLKVVPARCYFPRALLRKRPHARTHFILLMARDRQAGLTALDLAASSGHVAVADLLRAASAAQTA